MGNLVADAMLDRVKDQGVTIAIQNGGGLRASIDAGEVTMGEVLTVLPFQNTLATFEVTGEQIVAALENGVSQVEDGAGRFPQVAGLKYTWKASNEPGSRVLEVMVAEGDSFVPIDPAKTLRRRDEQLRPQRRRRLPDVRRCPERLRLRPAARERGGRLHGGPGRHLHALCRRADHQGRMIPAAPPPGGAVTPAAGRRRAAPRRRRRSAPRSRLSPASRSATQPGSTGSPIREHCDSGTTSRPSSHTILPSAVQIVRPISTVPGAKAQTASASSQAPSTACSPSNRVDQASSGRRSSCAAAGSGEQGKDSGVSHGCG
jgi:hypothetical protein